MLHLQHVNNYFLKSKGLKGNTESIMFSKEMPLFLIFEKNRNLRITDLFKEISSSSGPLGLISFVKKKEKEMQKM